jgi:hypothetical protein
LQDAEVLQDTPMSDFRIRMFLARRLTQSPPNPVMSSMVEAGSGVAEMLYVATRFCV